MPFRRYLQVLADQERGIGLPSPDHVPSTFLFAFAGARIVGRASIRHRLTAISSGSGGHIGYVVVPEFRRHGHATAILRLALRSRATGSARPGAGDVRRRQHRIDPGDRKERRDPRERRHRPWPGHAQTPVLVRLAGSGRQLTAASAAPARRQKGQLGQAPRLSCKDAGNMRHRPLSPLGWTGAYRLALVFVAAAFAGCAKPIHKPTTRPAPATAAPVPPLVAHPAGRPTVGVAFGGGSARGIAHVGVIRWLEEHRIPIDAAAGTSMGGLIGGAYASGMDAAELKAFITGAGLGSAVRRLVVRLQEHSTQGRRPRLSVAPRVRAEGRHRAAGRAEQRRGRRAAARPHRRALFGHRGLRRTADAVPDGGGRPAVGAARGDAHAARWPTRCAPRCRCR